ncbi:MAG TPA: aminoglycoside phosphotransferase family protein [Nitrospirota bacterium]|nr:aminoglycoside phosphotransferase family protein [Nitrospirota bacterium]
MNFIENDQEVLDVFSRFNVPGRIEKAERFGSGLINDTYLCEVQGGGGVRRYLLQRVNKNVFRRPDLVMENIGTVTSHIAARLRVQGGVDPETVAPALVLTRDNGSYHRDPSGAFWRMFHFIEAGTVLDSVTDPGHAREVGRAIGRFQALVSDLPPAKLHFTLPGFHHTPRSLKEYDDALRQDARARAREAGAERDLVEQRRGLAPLLTDLMDAGALPVRVVHNDPKVNNVMVDRSTGEALCMLDLDTVQPGIAPFDFGDCVRSAANPAGEDAEDLDASRLDLTLFESIARGYLQEAGSFLTAKEIELLPASVKVITFELGIRFLADYLRGDTYFKINYPSHNLRRARVQFRLLESIEAAEEKMSDFIGRQVKRE